MMSGHSFGASYTTWASAGASFDAVSDTCADPNGLESGGCSEAEEAALNAEILRDERIQAIFPMAGTMRQAFFGESGFQSVNVPVLFASGTEDNHQSAQSHFDAVENIDFRWLSLEGGVPPKFCVGSMRHP